MILTFNRLKKIKCRSIILKINLEKQLPYVLSPLIDLNSPGIWGEGFAYEKKSIFSIEKDKLPPLQ